MGMNIELGVIIAYAIGLILLYIIGYLLLFPFKWILRLLFNGILGGVLLFLINYIGAYFSFVIPMNIISALIVGTLGIPGLILLIVMRFIL